MRGVKFAAVGAVALLALGAAGVATAETTSADQERFERELVSTLLPLGIDISKGCGDRLAPVTALVARPEFGRASPEARRLALVTAVECAEADESAAGVALVRQLEPVADTFELRARVQATLLGAAVIDDRRQEAAHRLGLLIDIAPDWIATWPPDFIWGVVARIQDDRDASTPLLRRLVALNWTDAQSAATARNAWAKQYADHLMDVGDVSGARAVLTRVDEVDILLSIAEDRRYAALWPDFEARGQFEWRKVAEQELARRRLRMAGEETPLGGAADVIGGLRRLGRYDEAIRLGFDYRARLKAGETFADREKNAPWVLNQLAYALLGVGRHREAEAVYLEAIAAAGKDPVSQRINWTGSLIELDRPRDALALLAQFDADDASPYGAMWMDAARVCANASLDPQAAEALLPSMKARGRDNYNALARALLCLDRQDDVAALVVLRLETPELRADAIEAFREWSPAPSSTPVEVEMKRRWNAVSARPEVRAAFDKVGRIVKTNLVEG